MLKILLLSYVIIVALFYLFSNLMMFHPPHSTHLIETAETVHLHSASGKKITALYLINPKAHYTMLFSHGNAEDLVTLRPFLDRLKEQGFSVLAYDYQGYTTSEGFPTETNTYQAIDAAYHYLTQDRHLSPNQIILYGRSLGTGPTVDLAVRQPVKAVILESPFVSAYRVVTQVSLVPFDKFNNIKKVDKIKVPVFVLQGTHDKIVPHWHGKKIYAAIQSPKQAYWIEGADHNDIPEIAKETYWEKLSEFAKYLDKTNKK